MIGALDEGLPARLLERGVSRRSFLKLCAAITAVLALPATYAP
ncbi:MAG: twin-arginine translocation signal domain-containing protein, partial [Thermoplasmata archaeon]|nr:twin-arginine translocation signal domain-containing protein [Thermoplasmata archaeon]